jgi:hypothetical protein
VFHVPGGFSAAALAAVGAWKLYTEPVVRVGSASVASIWISCAALTGPHGSPCGSGKPTNTPPLSSPGIIQSTLSE